VDKITGDAVTMDLSKARKTSPTVARDLESLRGQIDLLIGMDHMDDIPREKERGKNTILYRSVFGSRYMVCENMAQHKESEQDNNYTPPVDLVKVLSAVAVLFSPYRSYGNRTPKKMHSVQNCMASQFLMDSRGKCRVRNNT
jgi:hypothetical protein